MYFFIFCFLCWFLQTSAACRVFWIRHLVREWTSPCRGWTGTSVKSSLTSSPQCGPRSWTGTGTPYAERSCCLAPKERTRSSSRSVKTSCFSSLTRGSIPQILHNSEICLEWKVQTETNENNRGTCWNECLLDFWEDETVFTLTGYRPMYP